MPPTGLPRLAVLIDAEYVTANFAAPLLDELTAYGAVTIRRAYGDWSSPHLAGWTYKLETHAITPVQRFAGSAGRSAAVSAIVIDALDLMYTGRVDGLAIVCNDGSFTPLATRLREGGATVVGLGRSGTARAFVAACDDYVDLDTLAVDDPAAAPPPLAARHAPGPGAPPGPAATPAPPAAPPVQPRTSSPPTPSDGPATSKPSVPSAPDHLPDLMSDTLPSPRRTPAYTGKHRA